MRAPTAQKTYIRLASRRPTSIVASAIRRPGRTRAVGVPDRSRVRRPRTTNCARASGPIALSEIAEDSANPAAAGDRNEENENGN